VVETCVFNKVSLPFKLVRRAEFSAAIPLRLAGHPLLAPLKEVTVPPTADAAAVDLDLAQVKLPPGEYNLHVESLAKLKYRAGGAAAAKEVTASFYSSPVRLVVAAAPITMSPQAAELTLAAGAQAEVPVTIARHYKYADAIDLALVAPNVKGLGGKGTIAKDQTQAKLVVAADVATPVGKYGVKLQATMKVSGQPIVVEQPITVTVTAKPPAK
jgi:hypothetical protein